MSNQNTNLPAFMRKDARTIVVAFQPHLVGQIQKGYTYLASKEVEIDEGDTVVVDVGGTLKLVTVMEVNDEVEFLRNSAVQLKWIVDVVSTGRYNHTNELDEAIRTAHEEVVDKKLFKAVRKQMEKSHGYSEGIL